jgi:hypothetical protein
VENNKKSFRWHYFIDKPFQLRFIARFSMLIILGLAVSLLVLGIANTTRFEGSQGRLYYQVQDYKQFLNDMQKDPSLPFYKVFNMQKGKTAFEISLAPMITVSALYLLLIIVFGLFISHKMAGPIYRIKKTLDMATKGQIDIKTLEFKLRKKDELQDLVDALNKFLDKIYAKKK